LELFDVFHLFFTLFKDFFESFYLLSAVSTGTSLSTLAASSCGTLKSETCERSCRFGKLCEDLTCGGTFNETVQGVTSLIFLIFVFLVASQHAITTFLI
jgi:hypothetical protein